MLAEKWSTQAIAQSVLGAGAGGIQPQREGDNGSGRRAIVSDGRARLQLFAFAARALVPRTAMEQVLFLLAQIFFRLEDRAALARCRGEAVEDIGKDGVIEAGRDAEQTAECSRQSRQECQA